MEYTDTKDVTSDVMAHEVLRRAYEAVYRFPPGFGGFRASVYRAWDLEGRSGTVEVRSPSDITLGGQLESGDGRVRREVSSIAGHRWPVPYEEADGRYHLALEPDEHPLGKLVRVEDDEMGSAYRISGGHIQQIERQIGATRFSINVQERTFTGDGRALPVHFCVVHWNVEEDRVSRTEIYRDGYIPVEDILLPLSRRIVIADDSGIATWQILFRDHVLLDKRRTEGWQPGNQRRSAWSSA